MDDDDDRSTTPTPKGKQSIHVEEANIVHFDRIAQVGGYDDNPIADRVCQQIADTIHDEYEDEWDENETVMLDYACGTGQMSRRLAPYVKKIVGVDISQRMVDHYNQRVFNQGISEEEMHAVCIPPSPHEIDTDFLLGGGQQFDLIICSQAYHHFPDIHQVTNQLAGLLKPGTGKLFVADLMAHDPTIFKSRHSHSQSSSTSIQPPHHHQEAGDTDPPRSTEGHHPPHYRHPHHHHAHITTTNPQSAPQQDDDDDDGRLTASVVVAHRGGFHPDQIEAAFRAAGLEDFHFIEDAASARSEKNNRHVELFVAYGRRPTTQTDIT